MRLIDADALIDKFKNKDANGINLALDRYAIKCIEDAPTIEERKGKWIVFEAPDELHCGLVKCPFCKEELIAKPDEYSYCPFCGADLREQP